MHACMHTYIHTYIHTYVHTCTHTYIHTYIYRHTYLIHTYIHRSIHTYIYIHTYSYMHTYSYIHRHTYNPYIKITKTRVTTTKVSHSNSGENSRYLTDIYANFSTVREIVRGTVRAVVINLLYFLLKFSQDLNVR
jgi:hypothetical protein